MKEEITRQAAEPGTFWADQFNNEDVFEGYAGIASEVLEKLGTGITAFCGAVGTAGKIVGVSRTFQEGRMPGEDGRAGACGSPLLTTGKGGPHRVEGTARRDSGRRT